MRPLTLFCFTVFLTVFTSIAGTGLPDVLAGRIPEADREKLERVLEEAGGNAPELIGAVTEAGEEQRPYVLWLILEMPHLDRLEMTSEILLEHVEHALKVKDRWNMELDEDEFRSYIVSYRMREEPVESWRRELHEFFGEKTKNIKDVKKTVMIINKWIDRKIKKREREVFGPSQSPLFTMRSRRGTAAEISVLAAAALKSVGIPSRAAYMPAAGAEKGGREWTEFYDGENWRPMYPDDASSLGDFGKIEKRDDRNVTSAAAVSAFGVTDITSRYTETGFLKLKLKKEDTPLNEFGHFSVCVFNDGALVPLDLLRPETDGEGNFEAELGDGDYCVVAGIRDESGDVYGKSVPFGIIAGETTELTLDLGDGRGKEQTAESLPDGFWDLEIIPPDGKTAKLEKGRAVIFIYDPSTEPGKRMLELVGKSLADRPGFPVYYLCPRDTASYCEGEGRKCSFLQETSPDKLFPGSELPILICTDEKGRAEIFTSGYDLNVGSPIRSYLEESR